MQTQGFTLIEVVVVLLVLGLIFGISAVAIARPGASPDDARIGALRRARAEAIRTGRPFRLAATAPDSAAVLFLPDGSAIGPGVEALTGAPRDAR